ncbi:MAG TPA: PAS domain S-box protein [Candidatus Limnocylindria bacterium]|nr:PAS domain S-box protein [Candidatus Limnocylindria bacterium]
MNPQLRILHLSSDERASRELSERLRHTGLELEWKRADSADGARACLAAPWCDAVLVDEQWLGSIPSLSEDQLRIPFIVITAHSTESAAVQAIKCGAADYLPADQPTRLATAIQHEISELRLRHDKDRAESALREIQERLRELVENLAEVFWVADPQTGSFHYISPSFKSVWGRSGSEIVRHSSGIIDTVHPDDRHLVLAALKLQARGEKTSIEYRILRPDGSERWIWGRSFPVFDKQGQVLRTNGVATDITESKKAQAAIFENQARLSGLIASAMDAIISVDEHMKIVLFNGAAEAMFGWKASEAHGRALDDLLPVDFSWQREASWLSFGQTGLISRIMGPVGEIVGKRANGESFPLEASISQTIAGSQKLLTLIIRDVTERRQAEEARQKLEAQLRRAQKLEAIGTLAGGIAHDFNNILGAILGHMDLLEMDLPKNHPSQESIAAIQKAARRGADLVKQMLTFSRAREHPRLQIDIRTVVKEVLKLGRSSLPASIQINAELHENLPSVTADTAQIQQLALNLIMNAAQAIEGASGKIEVQLTSLEVDPHLAASIIDLQTGHYVRLSVKDYGKGMDAATLEHLFEPFFTTKSFGEGSGFGLAVVHGIIRNHGGAIHVVSSPGQGTRFDVYLPASSLPATSEPRRVSDVPRGKGEHILFVDDEPALTAVNQRLLTALGYRVTTFNRPEDALQAFERDPKVFNAVIADLTMPGMSGLDLARRLLALSPRTPILLASGYASMIDPETVKQIGLRGLLSKPVAADEVSKALREILEPLPPSPLP